MTVDALASLRPHHQLFDVLLVSRPVGVTPGTTFNRPQSFSLQR